MIFLEKILSGKYIFYEQLATGEIPPKKLYIYILIILKLFSNFNFNDTVIFFLKDMKINVLFR